jgi:hypothetical protein
MFLLLCCLGHTFPMKILLSPQPILAPQSSSFLNFQNISRVGLGWDCLDLQIELSLVSWQSLGRMCRESKREYKARCTRDSLTYSWGYGYGSSCCWGRCPQVWIFSLLFQGLWHCLRMVYSIVTTCICKESIAFQVIG